MNTGRTLLLSIALILAGSLLIDNWCRKHVSLVIDGETYPATTYTLTAGGFLRSIGIAFAEEDSVVPSPDHFLRDGDTIVLDHAAQVDILADGKSHRLTSREKLPANLLLQAGIPLFPGDLLYFEGNEIAPDVELPDAPAYALQLIRARLVTLHAGPASRTFSTNATTLGQALWETGVSMHAKDKLSLPLDTPLIGPLEVTLQPSREIAIITAGGLHKTRSAAETVGEALVEARLPLQGLDFSSPGAEEGIPPDGLIRAVRVTEEVIVETFPLPFEIETQPVTDLELDQQSVVEEGRYGLSARRVRVRIEDGAEVSRQVEAEYIAQEPQSRILGYGTQVVQYTLDTPDGQIKYWRALNMYAVSYNHTSNGGTGTATGIPLAKGVAAVDINYIPFGTKMYVPGYGTALAADVGGGVKGRMIDLGYSDFDYVSWHQWVTVYFLWPPPETIPWIIP